MNYFIYPNQEKCSETLHVAVSNHDELSLEKIRIQTGKTIIPETKTEEEIRQLIRNQTLRSQDDIINSLQSENFFKSFSKSWETEPIINLVDSLLDNAIKESASDIHFEPKEKTFRIRFRKDGLLEDYKELPNWLSDAVLIRLKLLANVDITEKRIPQDGSFSFNGILGKCNIRLSTLPIYMGMQFSEKCVLRILPNEEKTPSLKDLNFSPKVFNELLNIFNSPQGLFLITGPTGSGKTTTLYSGLHEIINKDVNITTIEDPIEYKLFGANQVQVNEKCGLTFAIALRSILRQDPDVILIGEIRDSETAQIAFRAAQTGHLVFATLHTNDAKSTEKRLCDLGIETSLQKDSLIGIAAQRLLRKTTDVKGIYKGRIASIEILKPDGTYVDGTIDEYAKRLVKEGITDESEVKRVLGKF